MGKYRIWYRVFDTDGNIIGEGVHVKEYVREGTARNVADKHYGNRPYIKYEVCKRNPWLEYTKDKVCDICGRLHTIQVSAHGVEQGDYVTLYSRSGVIPKDPERNCFHFYRRYTVCPICAVEIKKLVDNLGREK